MNKKVLTGTHFMTGDVACAEGALAAGCSFFGGYPITPATEIAERMSERLPEIGGTFIQMEDEIAAIAAVLGASCAGAKAMTATSGPGFSLMMENLGLAACTETPCVVVDVQRAGPSTGLPTQGAQADMMQARWGSHGDYEIIALSPMSPQEIFYQTIEAFNLSETYRTPVLIMTDEMVGHLSEKVVIPEAASIKTLVRPSAKGRKDRFKPYRPGENGVAPMAIAGQGYNIHATGLTHDERGYPVMTVEAQEEMMRRIKGKIRNNLADIIRTHSYRLEDADIAVISYGVSARTSLAAVDEARELGIKAGLLRLITVWPFPEVELRSLAERVKALVTVEVNLGQIHLEVERCASGKAPAILVGHPGGAIIPPERVIEKLKDIAGKNH
ncbi:MAG: 2-oxoglutarate synthase subunit alpha [Deltaproteobacteria bacterium CG_4_8_14_3_um_filter_51_11]|nr:2-oxoacid:acceptor oxidoreductase subunit alpha [bacterium]OIP38017.1 MAG: 2-oxoglutarate synthase subunit alpha [Desulfobacteraceae bacterium CG2_30_51_40]PIP45025.1 MAG: 2-oxoglutarate synthase subunit alpha [Deltaproteobacteria bacterium CG23_combo_of_CG06-09_8_20_14_all_51_20]PIX20298.1 MAG: 2-oxoglutarate synthase subunit alpha [Deltaproteobacteria bacterium CG_4_8_14_3_um_filter_51_11]PIY24356.1 MAG: 2-oxoglutarate synthase subunit alpha [Deltaproteobacteria bacterium CG_4_10_14_3_um_f